MGSWPFHEGEREAQRRAGGGSPGSGIRAAMPDQHRAFFESLPFLVLGGAGEGGPVATVLAGAPGFVAAPDARTLRIASRPAADDPAAAAFSAGRPAGVLGIDLATRRRNRANGVLTDAGDSGLVLEVRQSFGNCPRYIRPRSVRREAARAERPEPFTGLDERARAMIGAADMFFVATSARTDEPEGGVDVSHRGGPPGFVRVDGDTLTIPDYAGNRYFDTLGNIVSEPRAGLLFVDFAAGDLLLVQGRASIVWDGPEVAAHAGAERLWRVQVRRGWHRRGALGLR